MNLERAFLSDFQLEKCVLKANVSLRDLRVIFVALGIDVHSRQHKF